jgi:hypothetical protein
MRSWTCSSRTSGRLREEVVEAHGGLTVHGGGDVGVGAASVPPGGIEDLRNFYKEEGEE